MKKILFALLPAALLVAGCNECKKGAEYKSQVAALEFQVTGTLAQPSALGQTCLDFAAKWEKKLTKAAAFANRAADEFFYSEERRCLNGHYERRCHSEWDGGYPGHPHRYWTCDRYFVCDNVQVIPHTKDGYEDAKNLANLLTAARGDLLSACASHERGADVEALLHLAATKVKLSDSDKYGEAVLQKAGCYDGRRGD